MRAKRAYHARPSRPSTGREGKARRRIKTGHVIKPAGAWANVVLHPECQIVSTALWQRANDMAQANAATSPRRARAPRLLKGLVYCEQPHGYLERATMFTAESPKHAPRYACSWRPYAGGKVCRRSLQAEPLENAVWALVCSLALAPELLLDEFIEGCERLVTQQRRHRAHLNEARAQVEKWQQTITNLTVARYSGDLVPDEYARARALAEARRDEAQADYERVKAQASVAEDSPLGTLADALLARIDGQAPSTDARGAIRDAVQSVLGHVTQAELDSLDGEGRRRKVRQVVERVEVSAEGVQVRLRLSARPVTIGNRTCPDSATPPLFPR